MIRRAFFWIFLIGIPVTALLICIEVLGHLTIPPSGVQAEGDAAIAYDPEIGFVPRPNSATLWKLPRPDGELLEYHLYTDRNGARVSRSGEQAPVHSNIVTIGDSFTWGHGVENQETFAYQTFTELGVTGANFGLGSYGTTQSLQMLRRNRELKPKLVIYSVTADQPRRNILACAPAYYPFCLDYSHVAWDWSGHPYIALPYSDGVTRIQLQIRSEKTGLDPLTRIMHNIDVTIARISAQIAERTATGTDKQDAALEYLIGQMVRTTNEMKAALLIVYIPAQLASPPPRKLAQSASALGYRFLDLSAAFTTKAAEGVLLYLPNDGHPNPAGHALVARELVKFIKKERVLVQD